MTPDEIRSSLSDPAFAAGFYAADHAWREQCINLLTSLAGGTRGMASCRRDGRCEREPQRTLERAIEALTKWSADAPRAETAQPPTTAILHVLAVLLRTPRFSPIHIKRDEVILLLNRIRALQDAARSGLSSLDLLGKLNYSDFNHQELGTVFTLLASTRDSLKEILK